MSVKPISPQFVAPTPLKSEYGGSFYHQNILLPKLLEAAICNPCIIDTQQEVDPATLKTATLFVKLTRMEITGLPRFITSEERFQLYSLSESICEDIKKKPNHSSLLDEGIAITFMKKHSTKIYDWPARR